MARRRRKQNPSTSAWVEIGATVAAIVAGAVLTSPANARAAGALFAAGGIYGLVKGEQSKWIGGVIAVWGGLTMIVPELIAAGVGKPPRVEA